MGKNLDAIIDDFRVFDIIIENEAIQCLNN